MKLQSPTRKLRLVGRMRHGRPHHSRRAYFLIEALVYIMVSFIVIGAAFVAFYQCLGNSLSLRKSADEITNTLHAGERWRADVRSVNGQIRSKGTATERIFALPTRNGEVDYQFATNAVLRRVGSGPWLPILERVKSSTMEPDARPNVTVWRWEVELQPHSKIQSRVRPLFTFIGVPERISAR